MCSFTLLIVLIAVVIRIVIFSQNDEFEEIIQTAEKIERQYGQYFDQIIVNEDLQKAVNELSLAVHNLETEPLWVPASWVR